MGGMCTSFYYLTGCLVGVTSHITPLPTGEGMGEGPAGGEGSLCQHFSHATLLSFRGEGELVGRRGASTFKNRPFLRQEGRSL